MKALTFEEAGRAGIGILGGKGHNLAALFGAGFPVPPGFVVPSGAYRDWISSVEWLSAEVGMLSQDPAALRSQAHSLRSRLEAEPLGAALEEDVRAKLGRFDSDTAFAVRSSSTFEDLADAAFAGQHDTFLNCRGSDEILTKIRECWCSLWTDRAILYRTARGFSHLEADMAVVVQQQVPSRVAGVAFSIHPVSGDPSLVAIDANYGLGESVVSGDYSVDHFEVNSDTGSVATRNVAVKDKRIVPVGRGTVVEEVPDADRSKPCLADEEILSIAQLAKNVQREYEWPQDIEWGMADGRLYLLQARPVTLIPPRWTRDESAERWPKPLTPLSWDYMHAAFSRSLPYSMELLGLPPQRGSLFEYENFYVYGNQNLLEVLQHIRPFRATSPAELIAQLPVVRERYAALLELPTVWMRDLDSYLLKIGALRSVDIRALPLAGAWDHLEAVSTAAEAYFRPNFAISMGQAFLYKILEKFLRHVTGESGTSSGSGRAAALFDALLGAVDCKTVDVNRELFALARMVWKDPELETVIRKTDARSFLSDDLDRFPPFAAAFREFIAHHGHRELFMDYFYPTWSESLETVVELVKAIPAGAKSPDEKIREARMRFAEAEFELASVLPEQARFLFKELVRLCRAFTTLDDLEHYQTTRIHPLARAAMLRLGKLLEASGAITHQEHVFFLTRKELRTLVENAGRPTEDIGATAAARSAQYREAHRHQPAWVLGEASDTSDAMGSSDALRGIPGSPGVAEGPCFLLEEPEQFRDFPKGAVLVARTTNPAWTPLFYLAAAVVTESGGPLSHGAVTAREMRLPAVMAVRGIMGLLKPGQRVRVDGTTGSIVILG